MPGVPYIKQDQAGLWRIFFGDSGPGGQFYKTFYHGNLLSFHGFAVILFYKTNIIAVITIEW